MDCCQPELVRTDVGLKSGQIGSGFAGEEPVVDADAEAWNMQVCRA